MAKKFNYQGAKKAGYSDEEIGEFLQEKYPNFKYQKALEVGYSPQEINEFLSTYKRPKSFKEKVGRAAAQPLIGAAEAFLFPAEMALQLGEAVNEPSKVDQETLNALEQKASTGKLTPEEELGYKLLSATQETKKLGKASMEGLPKNVYQAIEKTTGYNLKPENAVERGLNWLGFISNPANIGKLSAIGLKPKELIKSILPSWNKLGRAAGAGIGLELAAEGDLGPVGTMGAAVAGDLLGGGLATGLKGAAKLVTQPRKTIAKAAAKFSSAEKREMQKRMIENFRKAGIQADIGSITDSNLMRMAQARASQSGLIGSELQKFKENLSNDILNRYGQIADSLGNARFSTTYEAGSVLQDTLSNIRKADLNVARELYTEAREAAKYGEVVPEKLLKSVSDLERSLKPGSIKGKQQKEVLRYLKDLKEEISANGKAKPVAVDALINNKIGLNDIINYEVQGGTKQLLKGVVKDLDSAILSHGKQNPKFARDFVNANKKFSQHAKTFRNKTIAKALANEDPTKILGQMNSIDGIKKIEKALSTTPDGKQLLQDLKRYKMDQIMLDNMTHGVTNQVKLGRFANVLEKGKNRELIKELLPRNSYQRLNRLQKGAMDVMESLNRFYNASKSGTTTVDVAASLKLLKDFGWMLSGNPWPLLKSGSLLGSMRVMGNLMADPKFLKMVEDAIMAGKRNNIPKMVRILQRMEPMAKAALANMEQED